METEVEKRGDEWPQLLDLISNENNWFKRDVGGEKKSLAISEDKKLQLTLALPGEESWEIMEEKLSSFLPSSNLPNSSNKNTFFGTKQVLFYKTKLNTEGLQAITDFVKQPPLKANGRTPSSPVIGWPPVRSFRKNICLGSSKPSGGSQNARIRENCSKNGSLKKGLFVKINVDGIPIGRKVDLNAYNNYEKLSMAVEELFSSLLSAQRDPTVSRAGTNADEKIIFTGLLDGSGEYTLVYEDNEGDRMLVGDVPWDMFVSTAKRLRVLKNSELSSLLGH